MVAGFLDGVLEVVEGALLLRSRLDHLFDALHWQVDEGARLLTARGRHITSRRTAYERRVITLTEDGQSATWASWGINLCLMRPRKKESRIELAVGLSQLGSSENV